MSREYLVYGTLLLLSLVAVYLSSIADKTVGERAEITVFSVALADISKVHYYGKDHDYSFTRATDGERLVVEEVRRVPPDKGSGEAGEAGEAKEEQSVFLANEDFSTVLASFTPLLAKRELGKAETIDLSLFGLQEDKARVVLQTEGESIALDIGKKSYGSSEFYVQYAGTVYLVVGASIDKMARARALLFEEQLLAVAFTDGVTAQVQVDGNSMTARLQGTLAAVGRGRARTQDEGKWLVNGEEQQQFGNWLRRLRTVEVMTYRQQLPATAKELMTLVVRQDDDELERLRVWQVARPANVTIYLAQSKLSGDLYAELPAGRMAQLVHDLRNGGFMPALQ